ncbi:MAG: hypothetical protein RLZZ519_3082, partial [Bacteroidota bacterium]
SMGMAMAQKPKSKLKSGFTYQMKLEDGTNGAAVAWNPDKALYATVIAGNPTYPLETFDRNGKALGQGEAGFDWRGLWYNAKQQRFEGNGAGEEGWATLNLNGSNEPDGVDILESGQNQPDFQSVGAYDFVTNKVVFLNFESIAIDLYAYGDVEDIISIELAIDGEDTEGFNSTTVGFTGKSGYEFVLLDFTNGQLVFFNRKGEQTAKSKLPKDAPLSDMFCFSFTNDHAFLYDKDARIWYAYKVF